MTDRVFTYTADRRACYGVIGTWAGLLALEGSALTLGIVLLVPSIALKLALAGALWALALFIVFGSMLAPLRTAHLLTPTELVIRYGRDRFPIPRAALARAEPVEERLAQPFVMRAETDRERAVLRATFSASGQVMLYLDRRYRLRPEPSAPGIERIHLNVDDREGFLGALGLPTAPPESGHHVVAHSSSATMADGDAPDAPDGSRPPMVAGPMTATSPVSPARTTASGAPMIATRGLARRFGERTAVYGLDLEVRAGEIYGFLGPNGAGKSTTILMLAGLLEPTAGSAYVAGCDVSSDPVGAKRALGYVPDRSLLYERLTGREFLRVLAQLHRVPRAEAEGRIERLLDLLELADRANEPCGAYSFGMKRKLSLAGALLHRPRALILDEPLNGLDPRSARRLKDLFEELAEDGVALLLSTHDLATAEEVCDRIGILHRGRLVGEGAPEELRAGGVARDLEAVFLALTDPRAEAPT